MTQLSTLQKAALFAAYKALEMKAKDSDGECGLPPDTRKHVGGMTVTVHLPDGWIVERPAGTNGDGIIEKAATQNTYGFAVLLALLERAERFKQGQFMLNLIIDAIADAVRGECPTQQAMCENYPELMNKLLQSVDDIRQQLPKRFEPTPRKLEKSGKPNILIT